MSRTSIRAVPNTPQICGLMKSCVYRDEKLVCDDPRTSKGNSDSACHRMNNKDLLKQLEPAVCAANEEDDREIRMNFQQHVQTWMMECFSMQVCRDTQERCHRFTEEALELVQSLGMTASEAHQLVDYVYGRPVGETHQEVGGVMVTLAALCTSQDLGMAAEGEVELKRVWQNIEKIRAKQAAKPKHSPLPGLTATQALKQIDLKREGARQRAFQIIHELRSHIPERGWGPAEDHLSDLFYRVGLEFTVDEDRRAAGTGESAGEKVG